MAKRLILLLSMLVVFPGTQANDEILHPCFTHGDCQKLAPPVSGTRCHLFRTGRDTRGEITCSTRCFKVSLGAFCKKEEGEAAGICKREMSRFPDRSDDPRDCGGAVNLPNI